MYVTDRKGLAVTVTYVDAVETSTHTIAVGLCSTAGQRQQKGKYKDQILHSPCKGKKKNVNFQIISTLVQNKRGCD